MSKQYQVIGGGAPGHSHYFVSRGKADNSNLIITCECKQKFSNLTLFGIHVSNKTKKEDISMTTATHTEKTNGKNDLPQHAMPSEGTMDIPCHLIDADEQFNARHFLDGQGKDGQKIEQLAKTIKEEGQLSAVQVKPKADGRYQLIFGFRRFAAISWPTDKGGLGLKTIKATMAEPETTEMDLYYRNLTENVARENLSPYDLAMRCRMLVGKGETGSGIARRVGKNVSYINDLIRAAESLHPEIISRWKLEHSPEFEDTQTKVLTTDALKKMTTIKRDNGKPDHEAQLAYYHDLMVSGGNEEKEGGEETGEGEGDGNARVSVGAKRPGQKHLKLALEAAETLQKYGKGHTTDKEGKIQPGTKLEKEEVVRANAVIEVLKWALASKIKPGQTNAIKGIYSYKDGE